MHKPSAVTQLGADGPLATVIPGYQVRPAQLALAEKVEAALANNEVLVAEAGTGIGKTFAYLLPAIQSLKKVIIATGTKNLQDQLYKKDLPVIAKNIVTGVKVALLKGRANYLCWYRLKNNCIDAQFIDQTMVAQYQTIQTWAEQTRQGDISELSSIPEDAAIWPLVTSTSDNCLGTDCEHYNDCFLVQARREAQAADIVIINHHLFFADFALAQTQFSELLPSFDAVIFDEAHQLPEVASEFFGERITSRQLQELCRDTLAEIHGLANDMPDTVELIASLQMRLLDCRYAMGSDSGRGAWHDICRNEQVQKSVQIVLAQMRQLTEQLSFYTGRSHGMERCHARAEELSTRLQRLTQESPQEQIHWYEVFKKSFSIHHTPMTIAKPFKEYLAAQAKAFIFTSATLAVANDFSHYLNAMGLDDAYCEHFQSPFDYKTQAYLYLPRYLPSPKQDNFIATLVHRALPIIEAANGGVFFLFTSYRSLHLAQELLAEKTELSLYVQGSKPKQQLLADYREDGQGILLATHSFWEGVDVRGDALRVVIIDKLPFATPDDPILQARLHNLRRLGRDPFNEYQLPQAVIALRQGVGRLIRDTKDTGIVMLGDPRIATKAYGANVLASLPRMPITRDEQVVMKFLKESYEPKTTSA